MSKKISSTQEWALRCAEESRSVCYWAASPGYVPARPWCRDLRVADDILIREATCIALVSKGLFERGDPIEPSCRRFWRYAYRLTPEGLLKVNELNEAERQSLLDEELAEEAAWEATNHE